MKQIIYKKGKKQLVGDGFYTTMRSEDYDTLVDQFIRIGDMMSSSDLDPETRSRFNRYLDKPITHGNKGSQSRRDFITGIIKQKGIERKDFSTRQLETTQSIYNNFAEVFDVEEIEFADQSELNQARLDRYARIFEQVKDRQ